MDIMNQLEAVNARERERRNKKLAILNEEQKAKESKEFADQEAAALKEGKVKGYSDKDVEKIVKLQAMSRGNKARKSMDIKGSTKIARQSTSKKHPGKPNLTRKATAHKKLVRQNTKAMAQALGQERGSIS